MKMIFKHDDPSYGDVIRVKENPGADTNTRQHWCYEVTYANGESVTFPIKCISLPVANPEELIDLNKLMRQDFRGKLVHDNTREFILNNIVKILNNRHLANCIPSWQDFFSVLHASIDGNFNNTLMNLVTSKKRPIQVS